MGPNDPSGSGNRRPLAGLSRSLQDQFDQWAKDRAPLEEKLKRNYSDMMRLDPDQQNNKDTGVAKAQKARVFIGSTRGKIRASRAKILDVLFSTGKFPFDTEPSNEKLKEFADTMEDILAYQLDEGGAKGAVKAGVDSLCTYGTGYIAGPFVEIKQHTSVEQVPMPPMAEGMPPMMGMQEQVYDYPCPTWEHARTIDVYGDPEAESEQEGRGVYWASRRSPQYLRNLMGLEGYSKSAIAAALAEGSTEPEPKGSEVLEEVRGLANRYEKDGTIWVNRFFGLCRREELDAWITANSVPEPDPNAVADVEQAVLEESTPLVGPAESPTAPTADPVDVAYEEWVEAIVIMAGGHVIKASENTYKKQVRPLRRCVYEAVDHEMNGVGIADNNEPHQKISNAAFRLFVEGKSYALLPMFAVDYSKFMPSEDFKPFPGKRYAFRPDLTPEQQKAAFREIIIPDVTGGWEKVIEMSKEFSDEDTGITRYSQGSDAKTLNKTATGISMIMGASSLPAKEVIGNIDEMWIENIVEDLIEWNLKNLDPETVKMLFGEKEAAIWYAIQQFGKTSFMSWKATGSMTFMQKEVLMGKLQGFLALVSANPILANLVDMRELLEQVWNAGEVGKEGVVYDEETLKKNQQQGAQQQVQQVIQQAEQAIAELTKKLEAAQRMEQFKMAELASKERVETAKAITAQIGQGVQTELAQAQIDKTEAETVSTLIAAGVLPGAELMAGAVSKEETSDAT